VGRLTTPEGFASDRREAAYTRGGFLTARLGYAWAHGRDTTSEFADGHRERIEANVQLKGGWLVPAVQALSDSRTWPSDSLPAGARTRSAAAQLSTGARIPWLVSGGYEVRLDALPGATGFVDQAETRIVSSQLRSPDGKRLGGELSYQHRDREPRTTEPKSASDLGALRLRADGTRGLTGRFDLELSGDGESRRERHVLYAGPSQGAYDSLGNFVGTGDYAVAIVTSPSFDRVSRAVTSARVGWEIAPVAAFAGTRIGFDYETETRRRGDLHAADPWPSPAVVMGDPDLALARLTQRIEGELTPTSRFAALRLRLERQINTDRSYDNFGQSVDSKSADLTWRLRPTDPFTAEFEGLYRKQAAVQQLAGAGGLQRGLEDLGGTAHLTVTPDARLRAAGVVEATWSRPDRTADVTRAIRIGPELGLAIGRRGHLEMSVRRGFVSGAAPSTLLPTSEPAGPARWDATSRLDYRVHETTTVGFQMGVIDRPAQKTRVTGRCEVRALF